MPLPDYFTLNDRPVKVVRHPEGGYDVLALHMRNGGWEEAPEYLDRFLRRDGDLEMLTEAEFKERVRAIREQLGVEDSG